MKHKNNQSVLVLHVQHGLRGMLEEMQLVEYDRIKHIRCWLVNSICVIVQIITFVKTNEPYVERKQKSTLQRGTSRAVYKNRIQRKIIKCHLKSHENLFCLFRKDAKFRVEIAIMSLLWCELDCVSFFLNI